MQATDTKELPERSRYYQGILDVDELNKGEFYKELSTSYVIFICKPDIFEKGLAKYTFENICLEDNKIKLNDRSYKYFFIAENYGKILNEEQKAFLQLVMENKQTSAFTKKILGMVENAKHNTQWRKQFMDFEREIAYSFRNGKAEGEEKKAIEASIELLKKGISPEIISECLNIPLEKVLELKEQIFVKA